MKETQKYLWQNGNIIAHHESVQPSQEISSTWLLTIFEDIRAYWQASSRHQQLFRPQDHIQRFRQSLTCLARHSSFSNDDLLQGCIRVLAENNIKEDAHLIMSATVPHSRCMPCSVPHRQMNQPLVTISVVTATHSAKTDTGISCMISNWRQINDDAIPAVIKSNAHYTNTWLAQNDAVNCGFDHAIMLNQNGKLSQAAEYNLAVISGNNLIAPPALNAITGGITLDTIMHMATKSGLSIQQREIDRTELYLADEVMLCGTVAEILPITSIDKRPIGNGKPGLLTRHFQHQYEVLTRLEPDTQWSTAVPVQL